jgi:hypothetical protein
LVVAVNAALIGPDDFVEIGLWANEKLDSLHRFLRLTHGIPSHNTIGRLFGLIEPRSLSLLFGNEQGSVLLVPGAVVAAINGKFGDLSDKSPSLR